ncbi:MAG: hypothetical protein JRN05_03390 [Nitrososphaerota archaeon]|nr:hypothetical protein [Nitrososphaerota archaeon]
MGSDCSICTGKADQDFRRIEVWSNERWRLTMSTYRMVRGFCYLEPIKHVPQVADLEGKEAEEFGPVISRTARAIKAATGAKLVYVYIFGDHIPHLHVHLAPHADGDVFVDDVIKAGVKPDERTMGQEELIPLSKAISDGMDTLPKGP